ncbi:MAG: PmoA family protein [Candidatus Omnitrophota bacterium]
MVKPIQNIFHRFSSVMRIGLALAILSSVFAFCAWSAEKIEIVRKPLEQIKILCQGKEVAVYHAGEALDKSFIHPLWTPDRRCVTYDSPADHIHHRALSVGWPDVSGIDFWAESNSPPGKRGFITPTSVKVQETKDGVRLVESNQWKSEGGDLLVEGRHEWNFLAPRGNLQIADVDLQLTAAVSEVVFGSEYNSDKKSPRTYHGLTFRIGPFADFRFYNSGNDEGDANCMGKAAKWCAISGLQNGGPITAAIFDHPGNDSHPTQFFALGQNMQFLSSSPNYSQPKILKKGETWRLRYRVIAAGQPEKGSAWDLEALWREYAQGR